MKVTIIGLGTAGLTSAILLIEQGHDVTVYESVKDLKPIGAGILLQPTGISVLEQLGINEEIFKYGSRIDSLSGDTISKRKVLDLHYKDIQHKSNHLKHGLGIHRGSLFQVLYTKFQKLKIKLVTNCLVTEYKNVLNKAEIYDSNGLVDTCDLLIVANGARSKLRRQSPHFKSDKQYPWGALWSITPSRGDIASNQLQQRYQSAHTMLGLLPTGCLPDSSQSLVSLFWSQPVNQWQGMEEFDLDSWKKLVIEQWGKSEAVVNEIHSKEQLAFATYSDVQMKQWHDGNTVFIGDAAHAMSPQLGQGANLALIDAFILSKVLLEHKNPKQALEAYQHCRSSHLRFYQFMSRWLTPFYQSDSKLLGGVKDYLSYPASKIPIIKTQMLKTLSGQMFY